jgi:hypothetical protein
MAKFASGEEKRFSPISQKLIDAVSGPGSPQQQPPDRDEEASKVVRMRAVAQEGPQINRTLATPSASGSEASEGAVEEERLTRTMRYHVSPTEKEDTDDFIRRLSAAAKVNLTHSNIMRACRDILFQVEERLISELTKGKIRRPINDKRAIAFFESRLTDIIRTAIRQSPLPHRDGRD